MITLIRLLREILELLYEIGIELQELNFNLTHWEKNDD